MVDPSRAVSTCLSCDLWSCVGEVRQVFVTVCVRGFQNCTPIGQSRSAGIPVVNLALFMVEHSGKEWDVTFLRFSARAGDAMGLRSLAFLVTKVFGMMERMDVMKGDG